MSKERKETHGRATERIRPGGEGGSHPRRASAHFRTFPRTCETARKRLAARLAAMRVTVRRGGFAEGFSGCAMTGGNERWRRVAAKAVSIGLKQAREFDAVFAALGMLDKSIPMSAVVERIKALLSAEAENARLQAELDDSGVFCPHCEEMWPYKDGEDNTEAIRAALLHEQTCPKNPLVRERDRLREALVFARDFIMSGPRPGDEMMAVQRISAALEPANPKKE